MLTRFAAFLVAVGCVGLIPVSQANDLGERLTAMAGVGYSAAPRNSPDGSELAFVTTLEQRGLDVTDVLFADQGHGWRQEPNRIRSTLELAKFFRRHLLGIQDRKADAETGGVVD